VFSIGYAQVIHTLFFLYCQVFPHQQHFSRYTFPQLYSHPVDKYFSHLPHPEFYNQQISHILTGRFRCFSKAYPHFGTQRNRKISACQKRKGSKQVFILQKHSFPARCGVKNRIISGKI
jgi:hypothetical protein